MTAMRMTLDQCGRDRHLQNLDAGQYAIEYTDSTHLHPNEWIKIVTIDVRGSSIPFEDTASDQFYTLRKDISDLPGKPPAAAKPEILSDYGRKIRTIEDTLSLALGRIGLISPEVPTELLEQLLKLDEQDGVVIVPDTNALHNGAVHWLLRVLNRPSIWLMPVVASLTTIQTRDATIKSLVNKFKIGNIGQALRSRGLVNGALGLLERNKGRCQVVEIDPSLLRYQKMASSSGTDPDQSDVLEDRLIIEAIHGVLRSMRSRTARRVVTSDVNVARVLNAEGIDTLFVPSVMIGDSAIDCLRFDALARGFVGAPLRALIWELTHAFGTIRLLKEGNAVGTLECYWPGKTPAEWATEALRCEFASSQPKDTAPNPTGDAPQLAAEPIAAPDQAHSIVAISSEASAVAPTKASPIVDVRKPVAAITPIPRAALPQMLKLLGAARRIGGGTVEDIVGALHGETLSVDRARRPIEILRRVRLLESDGPKFRPTGDVDLVDAALRHADLDSVSAIMERFEAYRIFLEALKEQGSIPRRDVAALVEARIGRAGRDESERLPRFHIFLGQAWTNGDSIFDGSRRPTDRDATDAFERAFEAVASVGIAKVLDLLPRFCELTRTSPWAAKRQIEKFVAERLLPEYSFQPAAGGKPITRDEIISGSLDRLETEAVVIDRLHLGERPVFTIEGPSR